MKEVFNTSVESITEDIFIIDWLTVVYHGSSLAEVKESIGMDSPSIPWIEEEKYRNGYPLQCYWNGITISYGADDPRFSKDPFNVRTDMGICLNFSGTGCRTFESYGHGDWFKLLSLFFTLKDTGVREKKGRLYSYNITRLDLAFDDHSGLLDIYRIEDDIRNRFYTSRSKVSEIVWSDDQLDDLQGLSCYIGSKKSDIVVRIYDKAAERGFSDRHWIRVELQMRDDRARVAASDLIDQMNIGETVSAILRNYLLFRDPSEDTNSSRWPIADYWENFLVSMRKLSLWVSPGEEYNFYNTEHWLCKQYGQAIVVLDALHDPYYLIDKCSRMFPRSQLAPKYQKLLEFVKQPFDEISAPDIEEIFKSDFIQEEFL